MRNQMKLEAKSASPVNLCITSLLNASLLKYRAMILLLSCTLFMSAAQAQQCGCFRNVNNIGTSLQDEFTLTQWQFTHPGFPQDQMKNSCMSVQGILSVDKNFTLSKTTIDMGAGSSIVIKPGIVLTIDAASRLKACSGSLWQGITVMPGATLRVLNATIMNALVGIKVMDGASVDVQGTTFDGNYMGIDVKQTAGAVAQPITLLKNRFLCTSPLLPDHDGTVWANRTVAGIRMIQVSNVKLNANHFQNLNSGILLEYCDQIAVKGGTFQDISGYDDEAGQAVHLVNSAHIALTGSTYQNVDIGLLCQGSDVIFKQNTVSARFYGISGTYLGNRKVQITDNKTIKAGLIGIYLQDCISPNDTGLIEIARNEKVYGESGIVIWKNTTPLWIHDNPSVHGYKRDGLQLSTCSGTGLVENNHFLSTYPNGEEALEVVEVQDYAIMNNLLSDASVALALWNSQGVNLGCNTLRNASVGLYLLQNNAHLNMRNTTFAENLQTGMVLLDQANISPQMNHGNDWSNSNCVTDAMYIGASASLGVNPDNLFAVSNGMLPTGLQKVLVFRTDGTLADPASWFSLGGFDTACPLIGFDSLATDPDLHITATDSRFVGNFEKPEDLHEYAMQIYQKHQHVNAERFDSMSLSLSPQPANHILHINLLGSQANKAVHFKILDANGRICWEQANDQPNTDLDISSLATGFYVVIAENENGFNTTEKLIISR